MSPSHDSIPDDPQWELLARYVAGAATAEERAELDRWLAAVPERRREMERLRTVWGAAGELPRMPSVDAGWIRVTRALGLPASRLPDVPEAAPDTWRRTVRVPRFDRQPVSRGWWTRPLVQIAAALVLVGSATLVWTATWTPITIHQPVAMREFATSRGQRADFHLSDGTHVMLSVDSRLRVPTDFGRQSRDVFLEGEGYFEVRHDPAKRFLVHTPTAITEDLGTRFGVRAYATDTVVQVVVAEGRVAVRGTRARSGAHAGAVLERGQLARVVPAGEVTTAHGVHVDAVLAWTQGNLVFEDTPLRDALPELGRWYDLEFRLADTALGRLPLTATFTKQSTGDVPEIVALSVGLKQRQSGQVVTLYRAP